MTHTERNLAILGRMIVLALILAFVSLAGLSSSGASAATKLATMTTIANPGEAGATTVFGQPYVVKWNVDKGSGTVAPTGYVLVSGDGVSCVKLVTDTAGCTLPSSSVGTKSLVALYLGDSVYASSSDKIAHVVLQAATRTEVANSDDLVSNATKLGSPFSVEWSVVAQAPSVATPTGLVSVMVDGKFGCGATVAAGVCTITPTASGFESVVVKYLGNANFAASASDPVSHQITGDKIATSIEITNESDLAHPSAPGETYRVEWRVTANPPSALTPTGLMKVTVDGSFGCLVAVGPAGVNGCDLQSSTLGEREIVVTYNGNAQLDSASATLQHEIVNKTATQTTITTDLSTPTAKGQKLTIAWSVSGAPSSGEVTVTMGSQSCTKDVSANTCDITPATSGWFLVKATYSGDDTHTGSTSRGMLHFVTN